MIDGVSKNAPDGLAVAAETQASAEESTPRRRLRNYLLDRRFQLKYAAMVVAVTLMVSGILGALAYHYSHGQTEALGVQLALQPDLHPEVRGDLESWAAKQDRRVAISIVVGVLILGLAIGITSIVVTHRVVGPIYRMKRTFAEVAEGRLMVNRKLRKGDELQELFDSFESLLTELRTRRNVQVERIDTTLAATDENFSAQARLALAEIREEILRELPEGRGTSAGPDSP